MRGHEIGHLHGSRLADLPFPVRMRKELVAAGKARLHHVLPETGWVSYPIRGEEDVEGGAGAVQAQLRAADGAWRERDGCGGVMSAFTEKEIEYLRSGGWGGWLR